MHLPAQTQYKTPFLPVMPGHVLAEYNNLDSARKAIQKGKTAAVFVEPVQGGCPLLLAGWLAGWLAGCMECSLLGHWPAAAAAPSG